MAGKKQVVLNGKTGVVSKQQVRSMIKGAISSQLEQKRFVVSFTGQTTTATGTLSPVTQGVVQGDTATTRDGNQIVLQHLTLRHQLIASAGSFAVQRVIVVMDTMADGATPAVVDVLDSASYMTGYNVANFQERRFVILHDEYVMSSSSGDNWDMMHVWQIKVNRKITYNAATNVSGANGRNAIWVLFIADTVTGTYGASYELQFTDA